MGNKQLTTVRALQLRLLLVFTSSINVNSAKAILFPVTYIHSYDTAKSDLTYITQSPKVRLAQTCISQNTLHFCRYYVCLFWVGSRFAWGRTWEGCFSSYSGIPTSASFSIASQTKCKYYKLNTNTIHYSVTFCNVPLFIVTPVICFVMDKMQEKKHPNKGLWHLFLWHSFIYPCQVNFYKAECFQYTLCSHFI